MIDLEDIKIFNEILNNYKNVSMESKTTLRADIFISDEDSYLNEDYFNSLSKGYVLSGINNYYKSFFKLINLTQTNISLLNSNLANEILETSEYSLFRRNTELLKNILQNTFSYNLRTLSEYTNDGIAKWSKFAERTGVDISDDILNVKSLEEKYITQAQSNTDPLLNIIIEVTNHIDALTDLNYQLSQNSNKEGVSERINQEIKSLNDNLIKHKDMIEHYKSKDIYDIISMDDYNKYRLDIYQCFENIYNKGCLNQKVSFSLADSYINNIEISSDILKFLSNKNFDDTIIMNVDTIGKYSNVKIFKDNSMIVTDNEANTKRVFSNMEALSILNTIIKDDIQQTLKKKPVLSKTFIDLYKENNCNPASIYLVLNTYLANEAILKAQKFNIIDALQEIKKDLENQDNFEISNFNDGCEYLDDEMHALVKEHKIKQYAHSIASNKYMHLYDKTSYKIIEAIYDLNIESSLLQANIGRKIAAYHTPDEFNAGLKGLLNTFSDFTPDKIKEKAQSCNSEIIYADDNKMIVKIEDFNQSKIMGSSSWCIVRDEQYFKSYVGEYNHQYFVYDFSKESSDNESMIGITLTPEIECEAAHAKDDDDVSNVRRLTVENINIIVKNDSSWYHDELVRREQKKKLSNHP